MLLYVIVSHKQPDQVMRLARRLIADDPAARVVIHHDAAAEPFPDTAVDERIAFVPDPVAVRWGDFSLVSAVLTSIDWIARTGLDYRWLVLLSGQDYPIGSQANLLGELDAAGADGYIEHTPFDRRFTAENTTRYFFRYRRLSERIRPAAMRLRRLNGMQPFVRIVAMRSGCFFGLRARQPFGAGLQCYRGSFWWTLSRPCIDYVRTFVFARPDVVREYRRRLIPDESFFASILASADRFRLVNDDRRHIDWPGSDAASPRTLLASDLAALRSSGKTFARKFDVACDAEILDRLDDDAAVSAPR